MTDELKNVIVYIDGAAQPNPGHGGAGVVLIYGDTQKHISHYLGEGITNQQAEIMAAITALSALKQLCRVRINSDSKYLVNTMNGKFMRGTNFEFWRQLDEVVEGFKIDWHWIKGHNGNHLNEVADQLAVLASRSRSSREEIVRIGNKETENHVE